MASVSIRKAAPHEPPYEKEPEDIIGSGFSIVLRFGPEFFSKQVKAGSSASDGNLTTANRPHVGFSRPAPQPRLTWRV